MVDGSSGSNYGKEEDKEEDLIPGLPDDVSMQCLARISHGFEGIMQCVSKKWRDAFRSEAIGRIRAREGLSGDWLFVYTCKQSTAIWQAYDPAADRWHPLPPAPGFSSHFGNMGFSCVVLNCRLLVLGGLHGPLSEVKDFPFRTEPSNRVLCFDPFFRKWSQLPGMKTPRSHFACAVVDGCVLVAGSGTTSVESFDPRKNTWEALPEMPKLLSLCRAMKYSRWFQVIGKAEDNSRCHFTLIDNEWKVAPQMHELLSLRAMEMAEIDGWLYGILSEGLAVLDENTTDWRNLSEPPYLRVSGPEQSIIVGPGFMGLKGRLYLVGGIEVIFKDFGAEVVYLSTFRYCDPSLGNQVYWHDARPLLNGGGAVLTCAALEQE